MTITSEQELVQYEGAGVGPYTIPYKFINNSDIKAYKEFISTGERTALILTTDFSLTGAGEASGGELTLVNGISSDYRLTILRDPSMTQEVDYTPFDRFPAQTHEGALDKLATGVIRAKNIATRAIRLDDAETPGAEVVLPAAVVRANKAIIFDGDGNVTVSQDDFENQSSDAAASAAAAEAAQIQAEAARDLAQDYAEALMGTSDTEIDPVGTGTKVFTTQANRRWSLGHRLRVASDDGSIWMSGIISDYQGTTLTLEVDLSDGAGPHSSWNINISGERGEQGPPGADGGAVTDATFNNDGLKILDTGGDHHLTVSPGSDLTANRVLTIVTGDSDRTLTLTANASIGGTSSGTNTGDQTITLTGNVTGSGTGSFAATIANNAVTYAKMQDVSATDRLIGRSSAGAGDPQEITCTATGRSILDDASVSAVRNTLQVQGANIGTAGQGDVFSGHSGTNMNFRRIIGGNDLSGDGVARIVVSTSGNDISVRRNPGGGGGGSSLHIDTSVEMADGSFKWLRDIRIGDMVRGQDGPDEVLGMWANIVGQRELYSVNGVVVTPGHLFRVLAGKNEYWGAPEPEAYAKTSYGQTRLIKGRRGMLEAKCEIVDPAEVVKIDVGSMILGADGKFHAVETFVKHGQRKFETVTENAEVPTVIMEDVLEDVFIDEPLKQDSEVVDVKAMVWDPEKKREVEKVVGTTERLIPFPANAPTTRKVKVKLPVTKTREVMIERPVSREVPLPDPFITPNQQVMSLLLANGKFFYADGYAVSTVA